MVSRYNYSPGAHCPSANLDYAYRYEQIRFNYFNSISPNLEKRDEAGTLVNIYKARLLSEHDLVVTNADSK